MQKPYSEICRGAKYRLTGNGSRTIGALMESFKNMDPESSSDIYGNGKIINDFESEIAALLGKESAIFFPSGTMAQQIALRIWSDSSGLKKVAYHPLCHLEIHEQDGLKVLHHLEPVLLGRSDRLFTIEELKAIKEPISSLLIELPQREIGGQLPSFDELVELSHYCKGRGIKLHLDGARLFESLPYYGKSASDICALFDSVYVSFYKGIGGIAGAILAGSTEFTGQAKIWKRRHGGDLISLYPYIISAKYYMGKRMGKMKDYWEHAIYAAERLNKIEGIHTVPHVPVCNMLHVFYDFSKETAEKVFGSVIETTGLDIASFIGEIDANSCKSELSFGDSFELIPDGLIEEAFEQLERELIKENRI